MVDLVMHTDFAGKKNTSHKLQIRERIKLRCSSVYEQLIPGAVHLSYSILYYTLYLELNFPPNSSISLEE